MYQIKVDPHTHTLASGHAFSTIGENAACAKRAGMEAIGMSDHYGPVFSQKDGNLWGPSMNMHCLPKTIDGVVILASTEIDIVDHQGHLGFWDRPLPFHNSKNTSSEATFNDPLLDSRDYTIASVHGFPGSKEGTIVQNTEMYCRVLENPKVHIIGHPGRAGLPFDRKTVCRLAKQYGKMLEINDHSFDSPTQVTDECKRIALCCAEEGASIVVSSDAHSAWFVGHFERALTMLDEIGFPEELIANTSLNRFQEVLAQCRK